MLLSIVPNRLSIPNHGSRPVSPAESTYLKQIPFKSTWSSGVAIPMPWSNAVAIRAHLVAQIWSENLLPSPSQTKVSRFQPPCG